MIKECQPNLCHMLTLDFSTGQWFENRKTKENHCTFLFDV
jgi:hypothetical protein